MAANGIGAENWSSGSRLCHSSARSGRVTRLRSSGECTFCGTSDTTCVFGCLPAVCTVSMQSGTKISLSLPFQLLHQPEEQVLLSEITEVEPHPQEERAFVVRFSGARLPWTLRAKSKVRTSGSLQRIPPLCS